MQEINKYGTNTKDRNRGEADHVRLYWMINEEWGSSRTVIVGHLERLSWLGRWVGLLGLEWELQLSFGLLGWGMEELMMRSTEVGACPVGKTSGGNRNPVADTTPVSLQCVFSPSLSLTITVFPSTATIVTPNQKLLAKRNRKQKTPLRIQIRGFIRRTECQFPRSQSHWKGRQDQDQDQARVNLLNFSSYWRYGQGGFRSLDNFHLLTTPQINQGTNFLFSLPLSSTS